MHRRNGAPGATLLPILPSSLFRFFLERVSLILLKNDGTTSVAFLKTYFRSSAESIDVKSFDDHKQSIIIRFLLDRCFDIEKL